MPKFKSTLIVVFPLIAVIAFYFFFTNRLPQGVVSKGNETTVALISLWTAIISLLGTVLTLILKIIEIKIKKQKVK